MACGAHRRCRLLCVGLSLGGGVVVVGCGAGRPDGAAAPWRAVHACGLCPPDGPACRGTSLWRGCASAALTQGSCHYPQTIRTSAGTVAAGAERGRRALMSAAVRARPDLENVASPVQRGVVQDWDALEALWSVQAGPPACRLLGRWLTERVRERVVVATCCTMSWG